MLIIKNLLSFVTLIVVVLIVIKIIMVIKSIIIIRENMQMESSKEIYKENSKENCKEIYKENCEPIYKENCEPTYISDTFYLHKLQSKEYLNRKIPSFNQGEYGFNEWIKN